MLEAARHPPSPLSSSSPSSPPPPPSCCLVESSCWSCGLASLYRCRLCFIGSWTQGDPPHVDDKHVGARQPLCMHRDNARQQTAHALEQSSYVHLVTCTPFATQDEANSTR